MVTDKQISAFKDEYNLIAGYCDFKSVRKALEAYEASKPKPEPVEPNLYSNDCGDYWVKNPNDCDIFNDWDHSPEVGEEYELMVCWTGKQKFRVIEIAEQGNVKVELIESDKILYTQPPAREPLSEDKIDELISGCSVRYNQDAYVFDNSYDLTQFVRDIEKAHGIGV